MKNKEALNYNRLNISESELIDLLDEIIITSWYEQKKNISITSGINIINIYNNSNIELSDGQKNNMNFVLPKSYRVNLKKIPHFILNNDKSTSNNIHINNINQLDLISIPFCILKNENELIDETILNVEYYTNIIEKDMYFLCLTKKWKKEYNEMCEGINSWDIFNTLIARKCHYPDEIFRMVQNISGISNFYSIRKQGEIDTLSTYDNIYKKNEKFLFYRYYRKIKRIRV